MKKITLIIILMVNIFNVMAYDFEVDGIFYNIISEEDKTVEVTYKETLNGGHSWLCNYEGDICIPQTIVHNQTTYTVTRIGEDAFYTSNDLTSWGAMHLKSITLPKSIESIYRGAFANCKALTSIILPSSLKYLGIGAFEDCGLDSCIFLSPEMPTFRSDPGFYKRTCKLFVMNKKKYQILSSDGYNVIDMCCADKTEFEYSGKIPTVKWICNLSGYTSKVDFQITDKNATDDYNEDYHNIIPTHIYIYKDDKLFLSYDYNYRYRIRKKALSITINNATKTYGEDDPEFTYTLKGFVDGEDESVLDDKPGICTLQGKSSPVGTQEVFSGLDDKNYYIDRNDIRNHGTLTIEKAPLIVKVCDTTARYEDDISLSSFSYYNGNIIFEGLADIKGQEMPRDFELSTDYNRGDDVGEYTINISGGRSKNYYFKEYIPGRLIIEPEIIRFKGKDTQKLYGEEISNLEYETNITNDDFIVKKPTITTEATSKSPTGEYTIKVSDAELKDSKNYVIEYQDGILSINKRPLDAFAGSYEREYNQENPAFMVTIKGFVNGDTESCIEEMPIASTIATKATDVGEYKVETSGGKAANYDYTYHTGILNIKKAKQAITWVQEFNNVHIGDQIELHAKASSNLPIEYRFTSDNAEIYVFEEKQYLDCQKTGELTISASQSGNDNYNSAQRVSKTFRINETTSIDSITLLDENIKAYYDLSGKELSYPQKGIMIVKYKNGKTRTILVK